jgi:group II intron reverse transcriptase/maturase
MKEKKIKHHSLTGRIDMDLMRRAFRNVKRNRGAAGVDKVSIQMFEANLEDNLAALMRKLKGRSFVPQPVRRLYIPKDPLGTQMRPLGIPAVIDRVAQEVLRQLLEPIFEPLFHKNSFGFRPKRSAHGAIRSALACHAEGLTVVLDADISGFFDNIPHKVMMQAVCEEIADGNILTLIERFLKAGVMEDGIFKSTSVGTPQGGVLSPLIANITLNKLDWELDAQGYCFVRYADDFVVLCTDRAQAESALRTVQETLARLGLTLSPEKTEITTYAKGYAFLGFNLSSRSRTMRKTLKGSSKIK